MRSDDEQLKVILERTKQSKAYKNRRRVYLYSALMCLLCVIAAVAVAVVLLSPLDNPMSEDDAVLNGGNLDISSESTGSGNDTVESDENNSSESVDSMDDYGEKYITLTLSDYLSSSSGVKPDGEHLSGVDDTLPDDNFVTPPGSDIYPATDGSDEISELPYEVQDELYSTLYYRFDMAEPYEDLERIWVNDANTQPSFVSNLGNAMKWMIYYGDTSLYHTVLYLEGAENTNQYFDILRENTSNNSSISGSREIQYKSFVQDGKYMIYCVLSAEDVRVFAENGVHCSYVGSEDGFVSFESLQSADDVKSFCQIYGDGYTVHEP